MDSGQILVFKWSKCASCDTDILVEPKLIRVPHLCLVCSAVREGVDVESILGKG